MNIFRGQTEVEIGGKKRLVKFGINALALISEETGKDLDQLDSGIGSIRDLVWGGLASGCLKKGEKVDFTPYDVGDWIEEMPQAEFDKITRVINESIPSSEDSTESKKK